MMKLKFIIDQKYDRRIAREFECSKEVLLNIESQYKTSLKFLEITRKLYQKSWDEIGDRFSKYIEKKTGYGWFYPKYECVVSVAHRGISNWGVEPVIARGWKENPYSMRRITAHELIISHYFEIYKHHYVHKKLTENQVWVLAEIAAFALTSLTPDVRSFWPWDVEYYTNHNYPHIVALQNKLK